MTRKASLEKVVLPDFGVDTEMPELEPVLYSQRLQRLRDAMRAAGLDRMAIYADREHCANLAWLTGFDPRFEEALLILSSHGTPILLTGLENQGQGKAAPLDLDVRLYRPFGLMGQERQGTPPLRQILADCGLDAGQRIGVAGWKYFGPLETSSASEWMEIPAYLVDCLRIIAGTGGSVVNAGALLMDPGQGLRASIDLDELARFEFSACHVSESVKRVVLGTKPGMREFDAAALMQPIGLPLSCHPMFSSGERAWRGLPSPGSKRIERGEAVTTAYGVWGALSCRNGFLVASEAELPVPIRDYVDRLVIPYFEAVVAWLEVMAIGVPGDTLWRTVMDRLGDPFFGVTLNPGHLIHLDEWMNSPIAQGSRTPIASGMALQIDVIPATGSPYFTINMEDGIAILDERGRTEFSQRHPSAWSRIKARREFMADVLGIRLRAEVLPLSNLASWLPPFWLDPSRAMVMR